MSKRFAAPSLEELTRALSALTRRQFMGAAAGAGALAGLSSRMARAGNPSQPLEGRTLFFNFSHHPDHQRSTYYLVGGGRRHYLAPIREASHILQQSRQFSPFLSAVPDSQITHVIVNGDFAADNVTLAYVVKDPDPGSGVWSMASVYLHNPASSLAAAYERHWADAQAAGIRVPRSNKRQSYGHDYAAGVPDLMDEHALVDPNDHAATMLGMHPNLLSCEPNSSAYIHTKHITTDGATLELRNLLATPAYGAALPQITDGQPNPTGWATLVPYKFDDNTVMKNTSGSGNNGLIQYDPQWNPRLVPFLKSGGTSVNRKVQDDETLGTDVTGVKAGDQPDSAFVGKVWHRRDGSPTVNQTGLPPRPAAAASNFNVAVTNEDTALGFDVTATVASELNVKLSFSNSNMRWIGVYLEFHDSNGPVLLKNLPSNFPLPQYAFNTDTAMFIVMMSPEFEILGLPVNNANAAVEFPFPTSVASSVKVYGSTLSFEGRMYPQLENMGIAFTSIFSLIIPPFMMGLGAAMEFTPFIRAGVMPYVANLIATFAEAITDAGGQVGSDNLKTMFARGLARQGVGVLSALIVTLLGYILTGDAQDAIPIIGIILQIVAAIGLGLEITQTLVEAGFRPSTYIRQVALTHDVSVILTPDGSFPATATSHKVTMILDQGKPYVITAALPPGNNPVTVSFRDVPLGGSIKASGGVYSSTGWQAGQGETEPAINGPGVQPNITIKQNLVPIGPTTVYTHKQRTAISGGARVWQTGGAPTTKGPISCSSSGQLCDLRNITVRQSTSANPGYIGFSWQANGGAISDCASGGVGQLDQMANIGMDNPQSGYAFTPCAFQPGAKLAYNLMGNSAPHFYLDSSSGIIRRVQLAPPSFDDPRAKKGYGKLVLDATDLLLHPVGKVVSINNQNHVIEAVPLAANALDDAAITRTSLIHSGKGTRAGRMSSPKAATITPEGVVLVLEQDTNRLQAFDTAGNPVQFFNKQQSPYFLYLSATMTNDTQYLDVAVEFNGFVYVLSYNGVTMQYRLDLYHPTQDTTTPIATTLDFNAARIAVDYWRNIYSLNYEMMQTPDGRVEPTVSLWTPSTP